MRTPNVCKDCAYWFRLPGDPNNLAMPLAGECHGGPPQALLVPIRAKMTGEVVGLQQVGLHYPHIAENTVACRVFSRRVEILVNDRG